MSGSVADPFRQEVRAFFLSPIVDEADEQLGAERVDAALRALGVQRPDLEDRSLWVSLELCEAICSALAGPADDPAWFERCGRKAFSARHMGMLRPIVRAFGNPTFAYEQMVRSLPRFNKIGSIRVLEKSSGLMVLEYAPVEGAPRESSPHICAARRGQMSALPTLFDLPPATVEHLSCMLDGKPSCIYRISWKGDRPHTVSRAALLFGTVAGSTVGWVFSPSWPAVMAGGVFFGAACWLGLRHLELRRELRERTVELLEHNEALVESAKANEAKVLELTEAKQSIEKTVAERTRALRETTQRLEEALLEVRALGEAKNKFFANLSHELRTPLQLILGPLDTLSPSAIGTEGGQRAVATMRRSADRLQHVIDQLLDLARLESGRVVLARAELDAAALIRSVVELFAEACERRAIAIRVSVPEQLAPISLDRSWMVSALSNLIANAMRVSSSGQEITVGLELDARDAYFRVTDQGPGMSAGELFERFTQGEHRGAAGLGLAIVREAALLHGGEVWVDSAPRKGASVVLSIPRVAEASTAAAGTGTPLAEASRDARIAAGSADLPKERPWIDGPREGAPLALVVEDEADLRAYVAELVATRCTVRTAKNGREALELGLDPAPDVIIADVAMPDMDGLELCRRVRTQPSRARQPAIILVTARHAPADVVAGYDAGADDYVAKPFNARELLARLDVQLRLRKLVVEAAERERLASLGLLAAEIAHHILNPLNVIQNCMPILSGALATPVPREARRAGELIDECVTRIHGLTRELLQLAGPGREAPVDFKPSEGLLSACRMVRAVLPEGVELRLDVDETVVLHGRAKDLNHLFMNILDNAAQALDGKGIIQVRARAVGSEYIVEIEDSGPGIAPELLPRVFEPFVTSRAAGKGTGLGLSIARRAAEGHGGKISAERSGLGGAKLTTILPIPPRAN